MLEKASNYSYFLQGKLITGSFKVQMMNETDLIYPRLCYFARGIFQKNIEAEDVVQDAFMKFILSQGSPESTSGNNRPACQALQ